MIDNMINPISSDEIIPVKDLGQPEPTSQSRTAKDTKKHNFQYYALLGVLMIFLAMMGVFLGIYLKRQTVKEIPLAIAPTPLVEPTKEATPASTIEVIKKRIGSLEGKVGSFSLSVDDLYPPQVDFELFDKLDDLEK